jgi:hypothetical protein
LSTADDFPDNPVDLPFTTGLSPCYTELQILQEAKTGMRQPKCYSLLVLLVLILAAGCGTPAVTPPLATSVAATATSAPTSTPGSGVVIYYEESAQVELINPAGRKVLIDVFNPNALSSPPTAQDVLLTTHNHPDHFSAAFVNSFPGQQLDSEEGVIELPDVTIRSLASAHYVTSKIVDGTNHIFIIDMGGLRIVHLGAIGQATFTQEQLDAMGEVDIVFTPFGNPTSDMTLANMKTFNLLAQINPKLVIPTHSLPDHIEYALAHQWPAFFANNGVTISRSNLPATTTLFVLGLSGQVGSSGYMYQRVYDLPEWGQ